MNAMEIKLLQRLAEIYPTIAAASTEIINLQSIMNLPKGTEHFITDIHGEYEAFSHVLRNGSGSVKKKIDDVFGHTLSYADKKSLATLIYYPREKITIIKKKEEHIHDWYKITLYRLIEVCKCVASKYTRSKVRKALPEDFAYIIEELITEKAEILDKGAYYEAIISTIIDIGRAEEFIEALCTLIKRLVVDRLHILGDIYDRGPAPHSIMDRLVRYHSLDIQWGNHDIVWMGAAAGQMACIATVIRNSARYGNLDILEDGYGINMLPLATFAIDTYRGDPCESFKIHGKNAYNYTENRVNVKMHKAIAVIQFKLEGQLIKRRPEFHMENRLLLDKVDYEKGTITMDGKTYELLDRNFPTIDPADPYALTKEEADIMDRLCAGFVNCKRLQSHMQFLLNKGNLYKVYNGNLMYHGCVPMNEDGSFKTVEVYGQKYSGRVLYDVLESYVRKGFFAIDEDEREKGRDIMWFIWSSPDSPLFGKEKMATYERYFIKDPETHVEIKNPYYDLINKEKVLDTILAGFGLYGEDSHIINGHMPVRLSKGESPMRCNGKLLIIDGGFCKAYQKQTGIAGYTLIYNSYGMTLVAHDPFSSTEEAIAQEMDIHSDRIMVKKSDRRLLVGDTDNGAQMKERIRELEELLKAYRNGTIKEAGDMPGYIMHLAEGKLIQQMLDGTGVLPPGTVDLFEAGLLLPDTKRKKEKYTSHFWNDRDMDKLAIAPDLELFLAKYRVRLTEPVVLGYYAHLHLDWRFVEVLWPRCFQFLDGEEQERSLWDEIRQVRILARDILVPVNDFYSDAWYYGDYSRMNGYFQKAYGLTVPEPEPAQLARLDMDEVCVRDLKEVFSELYLLFVGKTEHKNEPLRVFSLDGLERFLQESAELFVEGLAHMAMIR